MCQVIPGELPGVSLRAQQGVHEREACFGSLQHRDGDRPVQLDHRGGREAVQFAVQRGDLAPVRGLGCPRLVVNGRDGRLELVRTGSAHPQGTLDERSPLLDLPAVPLRSILVGEQDQVARGAHPRITTSVLEQHEGEEAERLGLSRHQVRQHAAKAYRLRRELAAHERVARARRVPLVEDEVENAQDTVEPFGQLLRGWHPVRDPGVADLPLRTDEALCHGGLGDEKGAGDLRGLEPAEGAKGQRHARVELERRVATGEDEPQSIVHVGALSRVLGLVRSAGWRFAAEIRQPFPFGDLLRAKELELVHQPAGAPDPVDRPAAGRGQDPRVRVRGDAIDRPALQRNDEGVLDGLLGKVEVTEDPDERRHRVPRFFAEHAVDDIVRAGRLRRGSRSIGVPRVVHAPLLRPMPGARGSG